MIGRMNPALALLAVLIGTCVARADEIRLKDGTKISGTIVGFENDSFRVETAYGFALIRKDKVADINISAPKQEPEPKAKVSATAPAPVATPAPAPATAKETSAPVNTAAAKTSPSERPPVAANTAPTPAKTEPPAAKPSTAVVSPPAPPTPPAPPEPPVIRDEVRGNLYVNHTYGFQMYKPPSWEMLPAARKALPDAVAALGTNDQTTLLVIGRVSTKDSLDARATATGKALSGVYENYRLISNRHVTIAGLPAVEQRSRGTADGRDWSVILLTLMRGNDAFTLLGMTWADSDLIQVQENVIAKTVNSLTFQ
jgi:hypothetical protein